MNWETPYIVVRPTGSELMVLNTSESLRDARYWLQYLANPMDAIFNTPMHEQYKGNGEPTYTCHLLTRGRMDFHEEAWRKDVGLSASFKFKDGKTRETQLIELSADKPHNLDLKELEARFNIDSQDLNLLFSEPTNWNNWNSLISKKSKDVYVISVRSDSDWPLTLTLKTNKENASDIRIVVKPRSD